MVKQKSYKIIWDRKALDEFKEILAYLLKQSPISAKIIKDGVLSRLDAIKKNALLFETDKLKDEPNK